MPPSNLLLSSKVVMLEEPPAIRNITGVVTAVVAAVGVTVRGPVNTPTYVTSWEEYVAEFGGYTADSDLPQAVFGHFQNGGVGVWVNRVVHYTDIDDGSTGTAVAGSFALPDRGGAATAATFDSAAGPFDLEPGEVLEINIDGGGADTLTFTATGATGTAAAGTKDLSGNNKTFTYVVKAPGETVAEEARTITFVDADFSLPTAATHQEIVNAINARGVFISADLTGGLARVTTDKRGSGATMVITGTAGAVLGGTLVNATYTGGGNVVDIDAVTATEIATLLTALVIANGTATAIESGSKVRLASTATGTGADVTVTANTTADGIFAGALPIVVTGTAAGVTDTITVTAKTPGTWVEDGYKVTIDEATSGDTDRFNLLVKKGTATVRGESYPNLSMDVDDERYAIDYVNARSNLIVLTDENSVATPPANMPELGDYSTWVGQDDGLVGLADTDFAGSDAGDTGLYALDIVDDLPLLIVPGRATSAVHNAMVTYCEVHRVGSTFPVLDPPEGLDEQEVKTYFETTAGLGGLSEFLGFFWPRVMVLNPDKTVFGLEDQIAVPPSGHVTGAFARVDASRPGGVYQAAAGLDGNHGVLFGVLGFETDDTLDERKRDVVYPARINPITRIGPGPRHIDGSRTGKGDSNFPSIPERRGVIFIEQSLKRGLLFAKHRNNDRRLRMEVKGTIETFLLRQYNNGAFRGRTPAESFYVDVSDQLNPPEVIFAGELRVRVGLATQKPAEFIVVTITQDTRALEERLADALA